MLSRVIAGSHGDNNIWLGKKPPQSSQAAGPLCIPAAMNVRSCCSTPLLAFRVVSVLEFGHSHGCSGVSPF